MKTRSIPTLLVLLCSAVSLLISGCASNQDTGSNPAPAGISSGSDSYSPLPMNQAARTDAMRQQYRNEFR